MMDGRLPYREQALGGVRVLDFTQALAGPFCTRLLGELGADVLKVEPPHRGDMTRNLAPPKYAKHRMGGHFMFANCNKRGLCFDLRNPRAKEIIYELVKLCDIVVENFSPGTIERLGFGYSTLAQIKPALVMCSISAYGQNGRYRERRGGEWDIEASSGVMDMTGEPDGSPQPIGHPLCDIISGLFAFGSICAALRYRDAAGAGQYIDIAMLDSVLSSSMLSLPDYLLADNGTAVTRSGRFRLNQAVRGLFRGKDGWVHITAMTQYAFEQLCHTMGQPDLLDPQAFGDPAARQDPARTPPLYQAIEKWVQSFPSVKDVEDLLTRNRIVATVVRSIEEVVNDPHTWERGILTKLSHPMLGEVTLQNAPFSYFSLTPGRLHRLPPRLGEHNKEILEGLLGYSPRQVAELFLEDAIWVEEELQAEVLAPL